MKSTLFKKMIVSVLAFAMILGSVVTSVAAADTADGAVVTVTTDKTGYAPGDTVYATVSIENCPTMKTMGLSISFDSQVLELVSAEWNKSFNAVISDYDSAKRKAAIAFSNDTVLPDGTVFTMEFTVKADAAVGETAIDAVPVIKYDSTVLASSSVGAEFMINCAHGNIAADYEYDETGHWKLCNDCGTVAVEKTAHVFDNDKDAACNVCGYTRTVVTSQIVRKGQTLEYKDMIYVKVMYDLVDIDLSEVDITTDAGMLCWTEEEFAALDSIVFDENHALVGLEAYPGTAFYYGKSDGIFTRHLADKHYYVGYVKLPDGTYIYSEARLYGPTVYAYNMIANTGNADTRNLCVALLNYISAAQEYFYNGIDAAELANAELTDEQKALNWDTASTEFNLAGDVPADKNVEQDIAVFRKLGKTLRFQEMISLVTIYQITDSYVTDSKECGTIFWTAEQFAALQGTPSIDNYGAGEIMPIESYGSANMWCSVAPAVAAKDLADTGYYTMGYIVHNDGSVSYSGVTSYSFEQYMYNTVTGASTSDKMLQFAQRLYMYERAANAALK